jgi:hypothetical protein
MIGFNACHAVIGHHVGLADFLLRPLPFPDGIFVESAAPRSRTAFGVGRCARANSETFSIGRFRRFVSGLRGWVPAGRGFSAYAGGDALWRVAIRPCDPVGGHRARAAGGGRRFAGAGHSRGPRRAHGSATRRVTRSYMRTRFGPLLPCQQLVRSVHFIGNSPQE